jgi:hypothetical protein
MLKLSGELFFYVLLQPSQDKGADDPMQSIDQIIVAFGITFYYTIHWI